MSIQWVPNMSQKRRRYVTKETYIYDQRDLHTDMSIKWVVDMSQKRRTNMTKETYRQKQALNKNSICRKRDIHILQKRPTCVTKAAYIWDQRDLHIRKNNSICRKRDVHILQKRPTYLNKMTYIWDQRDQHISRKGPTKESTQIMTFWVSFVLSVGFYCHVCRSLLTFAQVSFVKDVWDSFAQVFWHSRRSLLTFA